MTLYYWDKEIKKWSETPPPPQFPIYGQAPAIVTDTIEPYKHPATGQWTDSRSALRDMDRATGTITTDKKIAPDGSKQKDLEKQRRKDIREAMHKAVAAIDNGTAPLTEEVRAKCEQQNEIISKALNMDAFNVAGRKQNAKGKKFRR